MKVKPIEEIVSYLAPVAEEVGVEIVEAKWTQRKGECALDLFIDANGGVDMNLCEKFHRAVDAPLDELDPTFGAPYTLNCSSSGLDRPFKTERDYARHLGEAVEIHLYAAEDEKKVHTGKLLSFDGETATLQTDKGEKSFPREKIAKACLFIDI